LGAFTAIALAAQEDSPFSKIVALGAPVLVGFRKRFVKGTLQRLPAQTRKSWYVLYQQIPGVPELTLNRVIPKLWRNWCPPGFAASSELDRVWASLPDRAHRKAAVSYYRFQFQPRRHVPTYKALHRTWRTEPLRMPILLLHGDLDGGLDLRLATVSAECLPGGSRHEVIRQVSRLVTEYLAD
jgi:pimeloyl-ACP methyl ester carboxylesterase